MIVMTSSRTPVLPAQERIGALAALVALFLLLVSFALAAEPAKRTFNVPAGGAERSLKTFSEQARVEVLFPTDLVAGVRTRSVSGELPPREALALMLAGTGLVAVQDEKTGALTLRQGATEPVRKNVEADPNRPAPRIGPADDAKSVATADLIELSPFIVSSSTDRGYLASNTLSGTRLNSKLEDLGSAITVVTKEQMLDTAVLDLNDVFLYEANTEGKENFSSFSTNRNGGVVDAIQNSPAESNRIRGVGNANVMVGNYAPNPRIPLDLYNVDAVEISRGPNSSLFGLGNTAGTVNYVPIRANVTRSISTLTFRADDLGGYRASIDLNRPLAANKLALRVAAVDDSKGFQQEPASEKIQRIQGMITARPFKNTTVRASAEHYQNSAHRPNSFTPQETVTGWNAAGRPTWDPTTMMVTLANGTKTGPYPVAQDATLPFGLIPAGYARNSVFIDYASAEQPMWVDRTSLLPKTGIPTPTASNADLRFLDSSSKIERQQATLFPLYVLNPPVTDKSLYDWTSVNLMSPNLYQDKANTNVVELEQILLNTSQHLLAARVGWFGQKFDSYKNNMVDNTDYTIRVDINQKLLDGSANPYFLRPYIAPSAPVRSYVPERRDTQSADLAYQWMPAKLPRWLGWIGQQKIGLHGETNRIDLMNFRLRDLIQSNHAWVNTANRSAVGVWTYDRFYVGDSQGQNVDHAPSTAPIAGQHSFHWFNALTNQWVSESVDVGANFFNNASGFNNSRTETRTLNATTQNYFFGDRVVTTFGLRRDRQRVRQSLPPAIDPATGWYNNDPLATLQDWLINAGDTKTAGVVLKATPWLHAFYNQSDSFAPAAIGQDAFGNLLSNPSGKGKDYGINLALFGNRLHLKLNRYETFDTGARGGDLGTVVTRITTLEGRPTKNGQNIGNLQTWSLDVIAARFAAQGVVPTQTQTDAAVEQFMGVSDYWYKNFYNFQTDTSADVASHGYEFEVIYNPTQSWRIKVTGAQQVAIDSNVGAELKRYLDARIPIWQSMKDASGNLWWTTPSPDGTGTPQQKVQSTIIGPYNLATANAGTPRSQVREWRWNMITNYTFTEGRLKSFSVGGALRWQDKASIGFLGAAPGADGVVSQLDPKKPVYDKARLATDLSASYRLQLAKDRIRARIQLNVRNVFENGRLQAVGVNPDGVPFAYRIIAPRQFILSTTFDL